MEPPRLNPWNCKSRKSGLYVSGLVSCLSDACPAHPDCLHGSHADARNSTSSGQLRFSVWTGVAIVELRASGYYHWQYQTYHEVHVR